MPQSFPVGRRLSRQILASAVATLAAGLACASAAVTDASSGVPDPAAQAGIDACAGEAGRSGVLASLCKNRTEIVALIRLCDGLGDRSTAMDADVLARWDRRNAPYLRWVGGQAAASASPPPDEQWLWQPPAGAEDIGSLLSTTFEHQFRSLAPEEQGKLCAHSRRSIDAGAYDLQPPGD